jgi:hypothetical protein
MDSEQENIKRRLQIFLIDQNQLVDWLRASEKSEESSDLPPLYLRIPWIPDIPETAELVCCDFDFSRLGFRLMYRDRSFPIVEKYFTIPVKRVRDLSYKDTNYRREGTPQ